MVDICKINWFHKCIFVRLTIGLFFLKARVPLFIATSGRKNQHDHLCYADLHGPPLSLFEMNTTTSPTPLKSIWQVQLSNAACNLINCLRLFLFMQDPRVQMKVFFISTVWCLWFYRHYSIINIIINLYTHI